MSQSILSIAQMRAWELATWAAGVREEDVIREAGRAVAAVARRLTRPRDPVLVLAGKGHNGDDACVAAEALADRAIQISRSGSPEGFADAEAWLGTHRGDPHALVIDGLFGIGLNRPLADSWCRWIGRINETAPRTLAVDVPSGLDADTGQLFGAAVRATVTLTLGAVKRGLLEVRAAPFVGRLELAHEIGLVSRGAESDLTWTLPDDFAGFPPRRPDDGHKGSFGHLAILAGSLGYHGAAVLAARGAQTARPGLVTVFTDERIYLPVASQLQAAMVSPWKAGEILRRGFDALLIGPGLAAAGLPQGLKREVVKLWKEFPGPVIADASCLDWLSRDESPARALRVLTPHPGEAARMLGTSVPEIQEDRPLALRRLAGQFNDALVILKGRHSLVGRATGPIHVNSTGNPGLAQGGTGDLLAGLLAGLLAQPGLQMDPLRAVRYGVWLHGAVADRLEETGCAWTTETLAAELGDYSITVPQ